jgi:hypothetical protein
MSRCLLPALLLASLLWATPALGYDPALRWHTIETPHFQLHYHDGLAPLAQRAARAAEGSYELLVPLLGHRPSRRIQIVLSDETDSANGSATATLRPQIQLFAVPPDDRSELNDYEDYLWNVVVHEQAHIQHLDEVGGLPAITNTVLGQIWTPNALQPKWMIEGTAIWAESSLSGGGRDRSSLYDMFLRAEVLEGGLPDLDDASGSPTTWPRGALAYLHGARFLSWVEQRYGPSMFAALSRNYGSQAIPFAVNVTAREELGESWIDLYEAWRKAYTSDTAALVERLSERGLTDYRRWTTFGEQTGEPRFTRDGRLLYIEASADERATLRSIDPSGHDEAVRELYGSGTLAVSPDGSLAVVSQIVPHTRHYSFEDLFTVELKTGRMRQLTHGERATEPDFSPDGRSLVFAKRLSGGRSALARIGLEGGAAEILYEARQGSVVYTPRFSPDGKRIAFSEQRPSGRDLRLLDLESGKIEDLTHDRALELNPTFDPSGRYLLFASDRSGIYDLYARDLQTGETWQVTNVLTGAFKPDVSPDATRLAFVSFSRKGYDVAEIPFSPGSWHPMVSQTAYERPKPIAWETRELYPVHGYRPLETLWPQYWLPLLEADTSGAALAVVTGGSDAVGLHSWSMTAGWGLASNEPYVDLGYATSVFEPELSFNAATWLAYIPGSGGLTERQWRAAVSARQPIEGPDWTLAFTLGYELRYYDPFPISVPADPTEATPFDADDGLAGIVSAGASWSNAQRFPNAISPERGGTISLLLKGASPVTGSQFTFGSVEAAGTKYLRMPWLEHHALALRLAGGLGTGDLGSRRVFGLGGLQIGNPLLDMLYQRNGSSVALRGYEPAAFAGNSYVLGSAEYRFPILTVDAGLWTLPIYVRRIHAALFADSGYAGDGFGLGDLRTGVGGELRTELLLGYNLYSQLRIGYARGLSADGIDNFFVTLGAGF